MSETLHPLLTSLYSQLENAEQVESVLVAYEAELSDANKLRQMNWSRGEVKQAIKDESNDIFFEFYPHLRREREAGRMYPGIVKPVDPGSG